MDFMRTGAGRRIAARYLWEGPSLLCSADNITLNPGSGGATVSADELAGAVYVQRVKVQYGADGTATDASASAPLPVQVIGSAADGATLFYSNDIDETEEEAKGSAGTLYGLFFYNKGAAIRYLKVYNNTAAGTTVGTTDPYFEVPMLNNTSGWVSFPQGIVFSTGITFACTTGLGTSDTGAPAANDVIMWATYK